MTTFKLKIKIKSPCIHFKIFQAQVRGKFAALNLLDSKIDALDIKEVLITAKDVLGKLHNKKFSHERSPEFAQRVGRLSYHPVNTPPPS